jgi:hypothetical protein
VTTLTEAVDQIRQICQSPIPASSRLENSLVPVA